MDNKLSELKAAALAATPGPWLRSSVQFNGITTEATFITQGSKPHVASTSEKRDAIFIAAANPAVVLDLLAELEAKTKHIADMERVITAAKCDDELWDAMAHRLKTLEDKLATPVRLPNPGTGNDPYSLGRDDVLHCVASDLRKLGFTVEGDEQ